jgi:hypothetical protein
LATKRKTNSTKLSVLIPMFKEVVVDKPNYQRFQWLSELESRMARADKGSDIRKLYDAKEFPSVDTIGRWKKEHIDPMTQKERDELGVYRWPDSHRNGALPWEAATVGVQFIRSMPGMNGVDSEPPRVGQVRWAYWLTLATTDYPIPWYRPEWVKKHPLFKGTIVPWCSLNTLARRLDTVERASEAELIWRPHIPKEERHPYTHVIEDYLLWQPWKSAEDWDTYNSESDLRLFGPIGVITSEGLVLLIDSNEMVDNAGFDPHGEELSEIAKIGIKVFGWAKGQGVIDADTELDITEVEEDTDGNDTQA